MKNTFILLSLTLFVISCKKENDSFIAKYNPIYGIWKTQSISYDSSGVNVTKSTRYDRLIINDNLTYKINYDSINVIENGAVKIISQNSNRLELYFEAKYSGSSSFVGSHIFGISNIELVSLSSNEMILKDVYTASLSPREYHFIKP